MPRKGLTASAAVPSALRRISCSNVTGSAGPLSSSFSFTLRPSIFHSHLIAPRTRPISPNLALRRITRGFSMASDSQQAYGSPPPQSVAWGPYTQPQPQPQAQPQPPPQLQPQLQPEIPRHDELANESEVTESKDNNQSEGDSGQDENDNDADRKRKRPMSVSCELCKQRKVKCSPTSCMPLFRASTLIVSR